MVYLSLQQLATLQRDDFPKLSHLQIRFFHYLNGHDFYDEHATPQLNLWEGLHVTITSIWLYEDRTVESLIDILQAQAPLASLSMPRQRHGPTPEQEALFERLPYPVYFA